MNHYLAGIWKPMSPAVVAIPPRLVWMDRPREQRVDRLPFSQRLAIISAMAALSWATVGGAVYLLCH